MSEYLTLAKAARLVGITRGVLQQQIRNGELTTFEGKLSITDLLRLYPQTKMEDTTMLERVTRIKAASQRGRGREQETISLATPVEVLTTHLAALNEELSETKHRYTRLVERVNRYLEEILKTKEGTVHTQALALHQWLTTENLSIHPEFNWRVLAARIQVLPSGNGFWLDGNASILEAALQAGIALNYGCSSGHCGKCKARIISGEVRPLHPHDYVMSHTEKSLGYCLLCSYTAVTDLTIEAGEVSQPAELPLQQIEAKVHKLEALTENLLILEIQTPRTQTLRFLAGQSVTLLKEGLSADYFIANYPCGGRNLQFHISRDNWFDSIAVGQTITLAGPQGDFILAKNSTRPAIFIAYEHGFAPIKSLIEHALTSDTIPFFHLYWLVSYREGPYLNNQCRSWTNALDNFHYTPLKVAGELEPFLKKVMADYPSWHDFEVYIAGPENFVNLAKSLWSQHHFPMSQLHLGSL